MAAGDEQRDGVRQLLPLEVSDGNMTAEVVDAVEGHAPGCGVRLGCRCPHQQRASQSRSHGRGDGVGLVDTGLVERGTHDLRHGLEVRTRGDLGHDAAEAGVLLHGRGDLVGADIHVPVAVELDDAYAGLVAGGFNSQDQHVYSFSVLSCDAPAAHAARFMVWASAPDGW